MKKILPIVLFSAVIACGCEISVVDTHTEKGSTETLSEEQQAKTQIDPQVNVPVKLPKIAK